MKIKLRSVALALGLVSLAASSQAFADAVIVNPAGTVALGVKDLGNLNTTSGNITSNAGATGLAYKFPDGSWRDATAPGCLCEGWGVSANGTVSGYANVASGTAGLTLGSFSSTASTATSVVSLASLPGLTVTHTYAPATNASNNLFVANVTITNTTGATLNNVKYVRVMDWDVPMTEFNEFVTIKGTATTTLLEKSHDDGFESANPLAATSPILGGTEDTDFEDSGPADHGAYFRFNFGELEDGESYTFQIFYGAAGNESGALAAIAAEGIELFSLGQSRICSDTPSGTVCGANDNGPTYIFGFKGVGGTPVIPTDPTQVPEPGSLALLGLGLAGLALRRRKAA